MNKKSTETKEQRQLTDMYDQLIFSITTLNENLQAIRNYQKQIEKSQKDIMDCQEQCTRYQAEVLNHQKAFESVIKKTEDNYLNDRNDLDKTMRIMKSAYLNRTDDIRDYSRFANITERINQLNAIIDKLEQSIADVSSQLSPDNGDDETVPDNPQPSEYSFDGRKKQRFYSSSEDEDNIIKFGRYPQGKKGSVKPIEWIVLERKDDEALLISKYALDCRQYDEGFDISSSWGECSLRKWLNEHFLKKAFTDEEMLSMSPASGLADYKDYDKIPWGDSRRDKVSLLSVSDAQKYLESAESRICFPTGFAVSNGCRTGDSINSSYDSTCWWWLKSEGKDLFRIAGVAFDGTVYNNGHIPSTETDGVRPVIRVRLA